MLNPYFEIEYMASDLLGNANLLVVDDDALLRQVLRDQLLSHGVGQLEEAGTIAEARQKTDQYLPDLVILDVELPDGNGFEFCQYLRNSGFERPIIMLTGRGDETDIVHGLDGSANDYIAKPMRIGELIARINAQLRQYSASDDVRFSLSGFDFVPADKIVKNQSGQSIPLTEKETMILKKLFRSWPDTVTKEQLLSEVWGYGGNITTHTIETHIYRLRQKLRRLDASHLIETIGAAYRLNK